MSKQWWWIGLTDESQPKGHQAIGAIVVLAEGDDAGFDAEVMARNILGREGAGILTSGEPMDPRYGPPPFGRVMMDLVLSPDQAKRLAELWCGGFASHDQIKAAFLDDEAKPGDPLFKGIRDLLDKGKP